MASVVPRKMFPPTVSPPGPVRPSAHRAGPKAEAKSAHVVILARRSPRAPGRLSPRATPGAFRSPFWSTRDTWEAMRQLLARRNLLRLRQPSPSSRGRTDTSMRDMEACSVTTCSGAVRHGRIL